ncbi:hypothetical protein SBOR_6044 [Sclerotinia borealis F-4128]|uniref:ubiquitinyl hydrolase 1 n=1 Tax=Sclerotinia borealis (strain F-4128) TaxID=1432307 RepID=W9CCH1_SCLBF|nr:hypothetical protein SBOR_6044 [Sclerotinia borealis F-4128]
MNGMGKRFTGKKDKDGGTSHKQDKSKEAKAIEKFTEKKTRSISDIFTSVFRLELNKKLNKSEKEQDEEKEKIEHLRQLLQNEGRNDVNDEQILFCLNSKFAKGDAVKAHSFLVVIQESLSGIVYPYNPLTRMLGAENPTATCWLDSLLCALFSVPTQFQELLSQSYEDPSKQKLIQLIRLWVNLLRKGILIEVAITERILDSLHECGWDDFDRIRHQDPTEAHMKIGDILDWPMLNLKVDFQHGGIESEEDDHKTSQERTVPISIPTDYHGSGRVKLEECIENSLNSFVQISRFIEPSLQEPTPPETSVDHDEKPKPEHVETIEGESTTAPSSPKVEMGGQVYSQNQLVREVTHEQRSLYRSLSRASALWPSKPAPVNNKELAQHLQKQKPMLGFDLKRYGVGGMDGITTMRINTPVDIPKEMSLPHFVDEDGVSDNMPIADRFKLVLRSMICHRGEDIHSGHYTSVVHLNIETDGDWDSARPNDDQQPPNYVEDRWMVHDDIADERVARADIEAALNNDKYGMPVTLWYELVPIFECFAAEELQNFMDNTTPPSYTISSVPSIDVKISRASSGLSNDEEYFDGKFSKSNSAVEISSEIDRKRASLNLPDEDRPGSVAATDGSSVSAEKSDSESAPVTPAEEPASRRVSRTFRRSKAERSRPTSTSNENRNTLGYFKSLVSRTSKESLHRPDTSRESTVPAPAIPGLDGFADSPFNGDATKPAETNGMLFRKGSKKGKKRTQSKGVMEFESKDKESNDPDRVCTIM